MEGEEPEPRHVMAMHHKHHFKIRGTIRGYHGKDWTHLQCSECPEFNFVEHGWFQSRKSPTPITRRSTK